LTSIHLSPLSTTTTTKPIPQIIKMRYFTIIAAAISMMLSVAIAQPIANPVAAPEPSETATVHVDVSSHAQAPKVFPSQTRIN